MQGFNRYFPPTYDPSVHPTNNSITGKHALGDRARLLPKGGGLIVRFELPFNIWCDHCENHIGAGVRYNAEKVQRGSYLSTKIWGFRCKCHLCGGWFELRTDPKVSRLSGRWRTEQG
jgi:coiled-coil domain-containing protein 130